MGPRRWGNHISMTRRTTCKRERESGSPSAIAGVRIDTTLTRLAQINRLVSRTRNGDVYAQRREEQAA